MISNGFVFDAVILDWKIRNIKNTYRTILDKKNKKKITKRKRNVLMRLYNGIFREIF